MTANLIGGLDEVGYGALAGPLVIGVAVFPETDGRPVGVQDSKKMSKDAIARLAPELFMSASYASIGFASVDTINTYGVSRAWQMAAEMALADAPIMVKLVVDGNRHVASYRGMQDVKAKADITDWQVSAASIIAKYLRDKEMAEVSRFFPDYGWETNAGYGSPKHLKAIKAIGTCAWHRTKYVRKLVDRD